MTIEDSIRDFVTRAIRLAPPPADDERLAERGFLPSLRLIELVTFLEDEFGIELRPVDLLPHKISTIAQLAGTVRERLTASTRLPRS